jgi:hypothetical protein
MTDIYTDPLLSITDRLDRLEYLLSECLATLEAMLSLQMDVKKGGSND